MTGNQVSGMGCSLFLVVLLLFPVLAILAYVASIVPPGILIGLGIVTVWAIYNKITTGDVRGNS